MYTGLYSLMSGVLGDTLKECNNRVARENSDPRGAGIFRIYLHFIRCVHGDTVGVEKTKK